MVPEEPFGLEVDSSHLWLRCLTFGPRLLSLDGKTLGKKTKGEEQEEGGSAAPTGEVGLFLEAMAVKPSQMIPAEWTPEQTITLAPVLRGAVKLLRSSLLSVVERLHVVVLTSVTNFGGICHDITVT